MILNLLKLPTILLLLGCVFNTAFAADRLTDLSQAPDIRAQLNAKYSTVLSSEMAAKITKLSVQEGDRFKKGDLLVAFNCAEQYAQLKKAQAVAKAAEKTYAVNKRLV
ncbi:MAG: biotin/lipoyl-binding protein, partial [Methylococcales bacterium]|nr:biotin/lipoyl-binding protein [Methylococcales bacterium]